VRLPLLQGSGGARGGIRVQPFTRKTAMHKGLSKKFNNPCNHTKPMQAKEAAEAYRFRFSLFLFA